MYHVAPCAYGVSIWRSMNSGTPVSSAPGPSASAGISRSTAAWTNAHSFASKKVGLYGARSAPADVADALPAVVADERRSQPATDAIGTSATDVRRKRRRELGLSGGVDMVGC